MSRKKKRRAAVREAEAAQLEGKARMTTEPFPPQAGTDPEQGTAAIAPVTSEMMEHAAHEAAAAAEAAAHGAPGPLPEGEPGGTSEASASNVEPAQVAPIPETGGDVAALGETAAAGALRAADLAFTHGRGAERSVDRTARSADSLGLFNAKVLEIAAANMSAAGAFVSDLMSAKSLPEAAAINADHMRRRLDALTTQGRELLNLAQKVAFDAMRPVGDDPPKP